jgi:hypothetical protein
MSEVTEEFDNGNAAQFNRNVSKTFLGSNTWAEGELTNSTYVDLVIAEGTVVGRNVTTGEIELLESDASTGSQIPRGITRGDYTVPAGETFTIAYATGGRVAEEKIIFANGTDTLATVVSSVRLRDRLAADTVGFDIIKTADELTDFDNELV